MAEEAEDLFKLGEPGGLLDSNLFARSGGGPALWPRLSLIQEVQKQTYHNNKMLSRMHIVRWHRFNPNKTTKMDYQGCIKLDGTDITQIKPP